MSLVSRNRSKEHENVDRWLLTYSDLITLLMIFFLMLYTMSAVNTGKFSQVADSLRKQMGSGGGTGGAGNGTGSGTSKSGYATAMQALRQYVENHGLKGQVSMHEDERGLVITLLSDNLLFAKGQAELQPAARPVLDLVAKVIKTVPNQIQIEGHTCDLPIHTERFPSNWELSGDRASMVLRYFEGNHGMTGKRMCVAGYASTRPIAANDCEAHRGMNRRVDIVIVKTDEQRAQTAGQADGFASILGQSGTSDGESDGLY